LDPYACYCQFVWITWHNMVSHGWAIVNFISKKIIMHHAVAFVKDESNNLTSTIRTLHSIVDYHLLKFHPYFLRYLFWSCHIKKLLICYQWKQGCYMSKTCQCEECLNKFVEDDHMDQNKIKSWMWNCMCWIKWVATLEIKNFGEN